MSESAASSIMIAAIGMAFTSQVAPLLRMRAKEAPLRLIYNIETFLDNGHKAINFRLVASDQRDPVPAFPWVNVVGPTSRPQNE